MSPEILLDFLGYKRQLLEQLLTVASIFGGFAVTGVITLRAEAHRDRVHTVVFGALAVAAIAFIFAAALDAIWIPISQLPRLRSSAPALQALLATGDNVIVAILIGTASLFVAVGLFGFARSRRMGVFVLVVAILAAVFFAFDVWTFSRITQMPAAFTPAHPAPAAPGSSRR
jgi:hypothetical protein